MVGGVEMKYDAYVEFRSKAIGYTTATHSFVKYFLIKLRNWYQ